MPFHISWSISLLVEFLGVVAFIVFDIEKIEHKGENNYDKEEVFSTNMVLLPLWQQPFYEVILNKNCAFNFLIFIKDNFIWHLPPLSDEN